MRSNDLRIGNWVYESEASQFPMQVVSLGTDYVYLDFEGNECDVWEPDLKDLRGIPITEDILLKCGFKIDRDRCNCYKSKDGHILIHRIANALNKEWFIHIDNVKLDSVANMDLKYVHELQSFVYMCTGEELKIELNK